MLNWNCLKVTVPYFNVVIYGLHTKSQHLIGYVYLLTTHTVVFLVSHVDAAPVQCMLILVLITLKQLLENQHWDSYNG